MDDTRDVQAVSRFCLIYENLPNVRAAADQNLELGTVVGRFFDAWASRVPEVFERTSWLSTTSVCSRRPATCELGAEPSQPSADASRSTARSSSTAPAAISQSSSRST